MIEKSEYRRIQAEIRSVLMDVWDPIGVKNVGAARDEYDRYIGRIYGLLRRSSDEEIAAELLRIEREEMGMSDPAGSTINQTIAALRAIKLPKSSG
jgi:hypothetical protein